MQTQDTSSIQSAHVKMALLVSVFSLYTEPRIDTALPITVICYLKMKATRLPLASSATVLQVILRLNLCCGSIGSSHRAQGKANLGCLMTLQAQPLINVQHTTPVMLVLITSLHCIAELVTLL
jgi:hypothetical protein